MKYQGNTDEYFEVIDINNDNKHEVNQDIDGLLSIIWFLEDDNVIDIDGKEERFGKDQLVCLTSFHKLNIKEIKSAKYLRFNRPFYCILDHDSEVGCKGILFFGSSNLPILNPIEKDLEILRVVWKMLTLEMESKDNLQLEMLQMMLKRILILITRVYKNQENYQAIDARQSDIVRAFYYLVEQHFREKHSVTDYAEMLNKSPKTISNLFGKLHNQSPLQMIQNRIMLEVRRMLRFTDKPISEIGYDLGFNDIQSFSRFFKKHQGVSPSEFRIQ